MDRVAALRQTAIFSGASPAELQTLVPALRCRELARGEYLWNEGDPAEALFVLESGQLKTFRDSAAGGQIITQVIVAGEAFGHPGMFLPDAKRQTNAEALEPCACISVPREPLVTFLERNPQAMRRMLEALAQLCANMTAVLTDVTFQDIRSRTARMLLGLTEAHGVSQADGSICIAMKLTQGTLAGLVGASRENVNRALAHFITNGDLRHDDGLFTILRPAELLQES